MGSQKKRVMIFGRYDAAVAYAREMILGSQWSHAVNRARVIGLNPNEFETVIVGPSLDESATDALREWEFRRIVINGPLSIQQDAGADTTTIEGTVYSNDFLRILGQHCTLSGPFKVISRADGVVTMSTITKWPEDPEPKRDISGVDKLRAAAAEPPCWCPYCGEPHGVNSKKPEATSNG